MPTKMGPSASPQLLLLAWLCTIMGSPFCQTLRVTSTNRCLQNQSWHIAYSAHTLPHTQYAATEGLLAMHGAAVRCGYFAHTLPLVTAGACSSGHHTLECHLRRRVAAMAALVPPRVSVKLPVRAPSVHLAGRLFVAAWRCWPSVRQALVLCRVGWPEAPACSHQGSPACCKRCALCPGYIVHLLSTSSIYLLSTLKALPTYRKAACVGVLASGLSSRPLQGVAEGDLLLLCRPSPGLHQQQHA